MNISLKNRIIDLILDIIDFLYERKKMVQMLVSFIFLGISLAYATASLLPDTNIENTDLMAELKDDSLTEEIISNETIHAVSPVEEIIDEVSESELQTILARAITEKNPTICAEKLKDEQLQYCTNTYNSLNETSETEFEINVPLSDSEIQKRSNDCLSKEGEINQNICWDSLYFLVATNNSDLSKCENIKDETTKNVCLEQTEKKYNEKISAEAISEGNIGLCESITDENLKKNCIIKASDSMFTVSSKCDKDCVDAKIMNISLDKLSIDLCNKAFSEEIKDTCYDKVYNKKAVEEKDSRFCDKINNKTNQDLCYLDINEEEDKNPEVQKKIFKEEDRKFPEIGSSLVNPLEEFKSLGLDGDSQTNEFQSVLDELKNYQGGELNNDIPIRSDFCNAFSSQTLKDTCEDSLILQVAIPSKNVKECLRIKNVNTREYCELEIIQGDALRAANQAKQQCMMLSSDSSRNKCLRNLGFFTDSDTENIADCLDFSEPLERILCMRKIQNSNETTNSYKTEEIVVKTNNNSEDPDEVLNSIDDVLIEDLEEIE